MTQEEIYNLYDKVSNVLDGFKSYHCWYFCYNEKWEYESLYFEVHITSDQGEGHEWTEYWYIDDKGRIHSEETIYENYEDFLREWM